MVEAAAPGVRLWAEAAAPSLVVAAPVVLAEAALRLVVAELLVLAGVALRLVAELVEMVAASASPRDRTVGAFGPNHWASGPWTQGQTGVQIQSHRLGFRSASAPLLSLVRPYNSLHSDPRGPKRWSPRVRGATY